MSDKGNSKEKIIKAAAKVFNKKGLESATVDDIAKQAGVAKGTVYIYFKDKDEILLEASKYLVRQRVDLIQKSLFKFPTSKEKLRDILKQVNMQTNANPEVLMMHYSLLLGTSREIRDEATEEFFRYYLNLMEQLVNEGINNKELKNNDSKLLALFLIFMNDLNSILTSASSTYTPIKDVESKLIDIITSNVESAHN